MPKDLHFRPPYRLRGLGSVTWFLEHAPPPLDLPDCRPLRVGGWELGVLLATHYDPPPEYPESYAEVVVARVALRGFGLVFFPTALFLTSAFHVDMGRRHYALPKVLDETLHVRLPPPENTLRVDGKQVNLEVKLVRNSLLVFLLAPFTRALARVVAWTSRRFPVIGRRADSTTSFLASPMATMFGTPRLGIPRHLTLNHSPRLVPLFSLVSRREFEVTIVAPRAWP